MAKMTQRSWDALMEGQVRDAKKIADLTLRLKKMARQVERLSLMVEEAYDFYIEPNYGSTLEHAERNHPKRPL